MKLKIIKSNVIEHLESNFNKFCEMRDNDDGVTVTMAKPIDIKVEITGKEITMFIFYDDMSAKKSPDLSVPKKKIILPGS